ncbi:hypothetical protein SG34_014290 [Thalassomonas viridans]|uniref:Uncharacterized protein n=1 Tax=Thalassomonas viridans TaxID=137584 RepID=A0AAF0CCK1_9GAMM|nr:hypothetical protein [Thalassomonas viridans]WDE07950.1 hypothetical protein SG34_014290 [Thalassomonas viridans]
MEPIIKNKILSLEKPKLDSYIRHLITRRLGTFSLSVGIVNLFLVIAQKLAWADWDLLTTYSYEDFKTGLLMSWFFLTFIILFLSTVRLINLKNCSEAGESPDDPDEALKAAAGKYKAIRGKLAGELKLLTRNYCLPLIVILLLITSSEQTCPVIAAVALGVYLTCYFLNKQHGYTRSWSRYEKTQDLLRLLLWEFQQVPQLYSGLNKDKRMAELHEKYVLIIENQIRERQQDIIGDYLSTNDAAFSWVKSLKK